MNLTADLTIMEEAHEFLGRVKNGGKLPMITSCSPGWIKFCEHYFPEMTDNLSTCKSPQQMFGATYKTYYAEKMGLDPKKIRLRLRDPLHGKEVRGRQTRSVGGRRSRCGCRHHHARTCAHDPEGGHRFPRHGG